MRNPQFFPVEVNRADYEALLRVPGLGVKSAKRILYARRIHSLDFDALRKIGVVLKRARYFITCGGRYYSGAKMGEEQIRRNIVTCFRPAAPQPQGSHQLSLFAGAGPLFGLEDALSSASGEL